MLRRMRGWRIPRASAESAIPAARRLGGVGDTADSSTAAARADSSALRHRRHHACGSSAATWDGTWTSASSAATWTDEDGTDAASRTTMRRGDGCGEPSTSYNTSSWDGGMCCSGRVLKEGIISHLGISRDARWVATHSCARGWVVHSCAAALAGWRRGYATGFDDGPASPIAEREGPHPRAGAATTSRRGVGGMQSPRNHESAASAASFNVLLNRELRSAGGSGVILELVDAYGDLFSYIHVSLAVNRLSNLVAAEARHRVKQTARRSRDPVSVSLDADPRLGKLVGLVRTHHASFASQAVTNVLRGLAGLTVAVDAELARNLAAVTAREAAYMNPLDVATTLDALAKLEVVARAMTSSGWTALASRVEEITSDRKIRRGKEKKDRISPEHVAVILDALARLSAAADATSPEGWSSLAASMERTAPRMNSHDVAGVLRAYAKLPRRAASAVSSAGWLALASALRREAGEMNPYKFSHAMTALAKLERLGHGKVTQEMTTVEGWDAMATAAERLAPRMNNGYQAAAVLRALSAMPAAAGAVTPSGWRALAEALRDTCDMAQAQHVAVALDALVTLPPEAARAMDATPGGWRALAEATEKKAPRMIARQAAVALHALAKLDAAGQRAMGPSGWASLTWQLTRTAGEMTARDVARALDALARNDAAYAAASEEDGGGSCLRALAAAAERETPDMSARDLAKVLGALSGREAAAGHVSAAGWAALSGVAERLAEEMTESEAVDVRRALGKLPSAASDALSPAARQRLELNAVRLGGETLGLDVHES